MGFLWINAYLLFILTNLSILIKIEFNDNRKVLLPTGVVQNKEYEMKNIIYYSIKLSCLWSIIESALNTY